MIRPIPPQSSALPKIQVLRLCLLAATESRPNRKEWLYNAMIVDNVKVRDLMGPLILFSLYLYVLLSEKRRLVRKMTTKFRVGMENHLLKRMTTTA